MMAPKQRTRARSKPKAKRKAARRAKPTRGTISLHQAPDTTRARVLRGIHQVLKDHGIAGRVAEMHLV